MKQWAFEDYLLEIRPLTEGEGGGFLVTFPDLPGCMADGETQEEAIADARGAFASWIAAHVAEGRPIPEPRQGVAASGRFVTRLPKTLHSQLAAQAQRDGTSINTLVVAYISAGLAGHEARRVSAKSREAVKHFVIDLKSTGKAISSTSANDLSDFFWGKMAIEDIFSTAEMSSPRRTSAGVGQAKSKRPSDTAPQDKRYEHV